MNPYFRNRVNFVLVAGILMVTVLILFSFYFSNGLKPIGSDIKFELKIEKGQGLKEIAAVLSQNKIIRSITVFKLYTIFTGEAQHLKSGIYQLNGRQSAPEIINLIIKGLNQDVTVTIIEGATLKEINQILSSANVIPEDSLIDFDFKTKLTKDYPYLMGVDSLEGFLYPDTYRFKICSSVEETVKKFIDNFQNKIWPLISQKDNWYQILILSSILEKEVLSFEDQQLVAGILSKRVEVGMPLQADATIAYAKCQGNLRSCPQCQVVKNDLKLDSPYNSYLKLGWPPTPISNINQTTIQAALNPKPSSYWFYLSSSQTKETIFSKTLEEHNKNRQKYL